MEQRTWKPTDRQVEFLTIPDSVQESLFGGAAGGGKSEVLMMLPIARGFYQHPRFKGLLLRRTYPELEKSLILRSKEWYPSSLATYNQQVRRWTWPSGAILDFGYAEHEDDVRRYDTTEYNYIGWDELTSFTEFQYIYVSKSRCRSSDTNLPAIVRAGSNPGNIGHGWVRSRFVEPAPYGTIIRDVRTGQKRIFIQSLLTDNPHLMRANPDYAHSLEMLPEAEKRAKLYGDWWTFSGQVFDDWRTQRMPDEPDNAIHVIEPQSIPPYWPRVMFIDWGFTAMTYVGKIAASPMGRAYLYEEQVYRKTKISEWAANLNDGVKYVDRVLDPSAWQQSGVDHTVAEQIMTASGLSFRKADNDRKGGKTLLQEYLRWRARPVREVRTDYNADFAQQLLRWKGMDAYNDYLRQFVPEKAEVNLPKLQVFNTCPEMIKCIPLCVYDKDDTEDVAEFDGDDPYDALRYGLKAVDRFYNMSEKAFKEVKTRDDILEEFQQTGNWTTLHNRMDKLERAKVLSRRGVRRFHGRMAQRTF